MIDIIINGQSAVIDNIEDIGIVSRFPNVSAFENEQASELEINVDTITVRLETKDQIIAWKDSYGAMVGIPTIIKQGTLSLDYYVDLTEGAIYSDHYVTCKLKKRKGADNFFGVAKGTTFELLAAQGLIFPTVNIPYVIVPDNQVELGVTLSISIFVMTQTVLNEAQILEALIAEAFAAVGGASAALAAAAIAKTSIQAIKVVALGFALEKLLTSLKELIFPSIRDFKGATVKSLISTYCASKGYTFQSSLLDSLPDISVLPVPLIKGKKSIFKFTQNQLKDSFTKGYPTSSDGIISTVGGLLNAMETTFNARVKVRNGVVELERRDFWKTQTAVQIAGYFTDQDTRTNRHILNTDEAFIRQYIHYQNDPQDTHTSDNFDYSVTEKGASNVNQIAPDLNLLKGLQDKAIPFAQGIAKTEFTFIEKTALALFKLIDDVLGTNTSVNIEKRKGVLQISQQFYSVPKLLIQTNGRQPSDYLSKIGAPALAANYHAIDYIENNSYSIHEMPAKMNLDEFEQMVYQEIVNVDGSNVELLEISYNLYDKRAELIFKKPNDWAIGKITTFEVN